MSYLVQISNKPSTSTNLAKNRCHGKDNHSNTNDMAVFTVRATQYVSGSLSTVKIAHYDILVRHHIAKKKNLFDRTRKAKLCSKFRLWENLMYMRINYMSNYIVMILYPLMSSNINEVPCMQLPPHFPRQFQNKEINYINHYQKFTTTPA